MTTQQSGWGAVIGIYFGIVILALIAAYPVMLALGIIHGAVSDVPPFGYLATFVLLLALNLVLPRSSKAS